MGARIYLECVDYRILHRYTSSLALYVLTTKIAGDRIANYRLFKVNKNTLKEEKGIADGFRVVINCPDPQLLLQ